MIEQNELMYSTAMMCELLGVSRSGYYGWRHRAPSAHTEMDEKLQADITRLYFDHKGRAGAPRLKKYLQAEGIDVSKKRVARLMRVCYLRAKAAKKYKATTNSKHRLPVAPNLLDQNFSATRRDEKWVSDITYIWTEEGWLYLATVMDCYSRFLVGWSMSDRMTTPLTCDALDMALKRRQRPQGVIVHSDRGVQYCAKEYQAILRENHLVCSMSRKGNCYDNAAMESWNHSFKVECIHGERFNTREIAKKQIFEYIEFYYNRKRLHSGLNYLTPAAFEALKVS